MRDRLQLWHGGVDLKDRLLQYVLVERKRTTKLFKRFMNATILNSLIIFRQVTGTNIEQLSNRVQLVEGLFTKCALSGGERNIQGRRASDNTVPRLAGKTFYQEISTQG